MASTSKKELALLRYSLNEDGLIEEGKAVESIDGLKELGLSSTGYPAPFFDSSEKSSEALRGQD